MRLGVILLSLKVQYRSRGWNVQQTLWLLLDQSGSQEYSEPVRDKWWYSRIVVALNSDS